MYNIKFSGIVNQISNSILIFLFKEYQTYFHKNEIKTKNYYFTDQAFKIYTEENLRMTN